MGPRPESRHRRRVQRGAAQAEGFVGDRASKRAFQAILDDWRERVRKVGEDPLGDTPSEELSKKQLDKVLPKATPEAAGIDPECHRGVLAGVRGGDSPLPAAEGLEEHGAHRGRRRAASRAASASSPSAAPP